MTWVWVLVAAMVLAAISGVCWSLIRRHRTDVITGEKTEEQELVVKAESDPPASEAGLEAVLGSGEVTLYLPVDEGRTFVALAGPEAAIAGTHSKLPTQLARLAVSGQAGVDAMLKAGQLSGQLVTVDPATARAIRAGTMVTDKAGGMLGIIRGESSRWRGLTRIKPVSSGLIKSASSGPAVLSAIAMQGQLANVEKAIASMSAVVHNMWAHLRDSEIDALEARRRILASVYRTASDTGQMTQALWDQIQNLEPQLLADVSSADREVDRAVQALSEQDSRGVGGRLRWLDESAPRLAGAVAAAAEARRSLVQFSMLRLWWLAVCDDPSLASRQDQMSEQLETLPSHTHARQQVEALVAEVSRLRRHHKISAPRKHKRLAPSAEQARTDLEALPWTALDIARTAELTASSVERP